MCAALAVMVVNKWALNVFPFPGSLMCLQFLSSAGVVRLLALCGQLECEPLVWAKARSFMLVPFFFGIAIFTNIKLLQAASVETAIVFRTIVPIFTSAADWIWMGRALPELRSACGLAVVVGGSLVYAATSSDGIVVHTWLWAWSYVLVLSFEMVYVRCPHPDSDLLRRAQHFIARHTTALHTTARYTTAALRAAPIALSLSSRLTPVACSERARDLQVKHVLGTVPMATWTRVYYNNALGFLFMPPMMLFGAEYSRLGEAFEVLLSTPHASHAVGASCAIGLGISFTGFGFRNLVTATTFTVVGVMNKLLTVLASLVLFTRPGATSPWAVLSLLACIGGGTMYRQAPLLAPPPTPEAAGEDHEPEENESLLTSCRGASSIPSKAPNGAAG